MLGARLPKLHAIPRSHTFWVKYWGFWGGVQYLAFCFRRTMPPSFASPAGSPSGSAAPGLTKVPSTLAPGGYSIIGYRSEVTFSPSEQRAGWSLWLTVTLFRCLPCDC